MAGCLIEIARVEDLALTVDLTPLDDAHLLPGLCEKPIPRPDRVRG